ncbi:MAG: hypothetical protein P9M07_05360 [Candidatus Aceula meridiana]|nr:hypothetical protein [Candidatus Aceula meridiana]
MKEDLNKKLKIWQVIVLVQMILIIALATFASQQQRTLSTQNSAIYGLRASLEDREQKLLSTMVLLRRAAAEISQAGQPAE